MTARRNVFQTMEPFFSTGLIVSFMPISCPGTDAFKAQLPLIMSQGFVGVDPLYTLIRSSP